MQSCPKAASSWVWVSPATAHTIPYHSNHATAAKATAVAAAAAAPVAVRPQVQHLQTATYKRIRIFVRWAVATHTLICGAQTAAVLQRKMWKRLQGHPKANSRGHCLQSPFSNWRPEAVTSHLLASFDRVSWLEGRLVSRSWSGACASELAKLPLCDKLRSQSVLIPE